jgi:DNA-binding MarR family transcriptional regulator
VRRRDCILEALVALRVVSPRISVNEIVAFLYTCENEGLSVQELAFVSGMTQSTASRSLRSLGRPGTDWAQAPALGLIEPYLHPSDGRSHLLHLTEEGRRLRDQLDEIIARGIHIGGA